LVLNKVDRVEDRSYIDVLMRHHPKAVAISAGKRQGLDTLAAAVMDELKADFADAEIVTGAGNGKVLAYLAAHAEVYGKEYEDSQVTVRCWIPRQLLHHIEGPEVSVRFLKESRPTANKVR
jgi:GTPase